MKTVYIKRLDGEVVTCPENTGVTFLRNGMVQVETPNLVYLTGRDHIEIIADDVDELWDNE